MIKLHAVVLAMALGACDDRQTWRTPEPSLERMLEQPRVDPFETAMRVPPPGAVPRDRYGAGDPLITAGKDGDGYARRVPIATTRPLLELGRMRFETVCAACHGILGDGESVVATKMELRRPPSLHEARIRDLPPGRIYEDITMGYGLMPSLEPLLSTEERWAVVAYVDALRLSRAVPAAALPSDMRASLAREAP